MAYINLPAPEIRLDWTPRGNDDLDSAQRFHRVIPNANGGPFIAPPVTWGPGVLLGEMDAFAIQLGQFGYGFGPFPGGVLANRMQFPGNSSALKKKGR